ncbi:flagellar basal body-associated FliL family protein [Palleronia abyssalis]|uniref:Flagellar protein FliL n=1 Tax=Palleronia abyssalis TaxID=1501240 RepID=A0A2R8BWZ5_9RHOB|nr:flagellar basal body-associated FliL family protein [Palleronia abyssalis]SPJ24653.1 Flagellar FliL protein [Palleronia abyssalis]
MAEDGEDEPPKKGRTGLIIGAIAAVLLGGGGFYAVWSGLILGGASEEVESAGADDGAAVEEIEIIGSLTAEEVGFIAVEPLVVSLSGQNNNRHLRFRAQLEVANRHKADVEHLMPRVIDVMNGYLRAVEPSSLSTAGALMQIRAQLLRRVDMVVGAGKVRDVLVMEFVLS